ncbi:VOC family protein [Seongchinamella unica]|uniref:VOC family protein n=1 Tax=Seongchinamella unica TaxID=2547392 RepID=A0A4R5LRE2_9GAMM|nr:VOC family protein [Seongchinamella unica]TDG13356.1 VOC family protein [Seongchinamella unica]
MKALKLVLLASAVVALTVACAATRVDIPSLAADEEGADLPGKFVWHDLITDTPAQTREFYRQLFGWEFRPLPGGVNYEMIYHRGTAIGGMVDQTRLPAQVDISQWVAVLAVADVTAATEYFRTRGGTVFTPPTSLGERGRIAVVADPQQAVLALLQTDGRDPGDTEAPEGAGNFLWNELWTADAASASGFYAGLAPYQQETRAMQIGTQTVDYHLLESAGRPRAGIRNKPIPELPSHWVSYVSVDNQSALEQILSRVEQLGGRVLVPATGRLQGGGSVALIAGPSGAGIALQTWPQQTVSVAGEAW